MRQNLNRISVRGAWGVDLETRYPYFGFLVKYPWLKLKKVWARLCFDARNYRHYGSKQYEESGIRHALVLLIEKMKYG